MVETKTLSGHYEARVSSDAIPGGRVTCLQPNPQGAGEGICGNCGKSLRYNPDRFETVVELACSTDCAKEMGFYPERPEWEPTERHSRSKSDREATCPHCGGPRAGRGWTHTDDCDRGKSAETEESPPDRDIPDEPGKASEPIPPKPKRDNCPVCGGPPWKRGWKHAEGCSNSAKAKVEAAAEAKRAERAANGHVPAPKGKRRPRGMFDD